MTRKGNFAGRTALTLVIVALLSSLLAMALEFSGEAEPRTVNASAFSYSAIGHRGLVAFLEAYDVETEISQYSNSFGATSEDLLLFLEPEPSWFLSLLGLGLSDTTQPILVALPKRRGFRSQDDPRWLGSVEAEPDERVMAVLQALAPGARLVRNAAPESWSVNAFANAPTLTDVQLMELDDQKALIGSNAGTLLAEIRGGAQPVWLLSDPDMLSNHGLGRGANAALVLAIIQRLLPEGQGIVIDETSHGYILQPDLLRQLVQLPFLVCTLLAIASLIVLLWGMGGRFGPTLRPAPRLRPGKTGLIDNTAGLLVAGGHDKALLNRYVDFTVADIARKLHAPDGMDEQAKVAWLDRLSRARKAKRGARDLITYLQKVGGSGRQSDRVAVVRAARRLNQWKKDLLDES